MGIFDTTLYKKILVTGSSAVLGSALKTSSKEYPGKEFVFLTSEDCDLTDLNATKKLLSSIRPDAVIHLAAVSGGIGLSMKHPASMLRDITFMTLNILEAARINETKKIIMTLTTGMYPVNAPLPLVEENIHDGYPHESNYGSSFAKRLVDPAVRAYREEFGMNVIGLIPSGIFGENDNFNFEDAPMLPALIRRFYESKDNDEKIVVWGDGSPLREYTYATDLAEIFMWALENYNETQCINIGTTEENSIKDIAFMIADNIGIDKNRIVFDTTKPNGIYRKNISNEKFTKLANFSYTPFKEALEKTIRWFGATYENNPELLRLYSKSRNL
jgi:GDP-L-fucose synthase